jgi:hypothetical protein
MTQSGHNPPHIAYRCAPNLLCSNRNWRRLDLMDGYVRRRDFIKVIAASAAAWPLATRAEQPATLVGFLRSTRAEESGHLVAAVREGLRDSGYSSDKVIIEARWGMAEKSNW